MIYYEFCILNNISQSHHPKSKRSHIDIVKKYEQTWHEMNDNFGLLIKTSNFSFFNIPSMSLAYSAYFLRGQWLANSACWGLTFVILVDRVNHVFEDVADLESESTRMNCTLHPEALCGCYVPFKEEPPVGNWRYFHWIWVSKDLSQMRYLPYK